jgi:hypothetical protein
MHYGKKNITRLIFLFICLLIYFRNNFNADIIFNQDLVFNGNLSVKNNVNINGPLLLSNINTNTTISGNFTVSSDSPTTVIFENCNEVHLKSVQDFTGINPLYLIIDINTDQVYSTPVMRNNFNIYELIVNNIISNPDQNLTIGQSGNNITIGNEQNNIIFEKKLCALGGITSNNDSINLNGDVYFTENLNAVDITTTNADITIGQNRTDIENIINCQNFTINEPLTFYDTCIVGNSNLEDTININGYISTQNITFGSENNPVATVTGLPVINNPQAYLISNTDNTISIIDTVTGNLPTISIDTLTTDILNVNKIIASTPNEDIFFITPILNILTDNCQYQRVALNLENIYSQSIIKNYLTVVYISPNKQPPNFYSNIIHVRPNKKIETISFFQSPNSSGFKIDTLICNAENYFFKNLTTTTENTNNICLDKTNNNLVFTAIADYNKNINIDSNLLSPVSFNYNDNYTIKNNDICNKTKEKIVHFGFIAEDLTILNEPNILTYDTEGYIYDYKTDILWNTINKKIIEYQNYLTYANLVLEKITTYNQNLAQDIKKQEQQIAAKKKIYQKTKNINTKG